MGLVNEVDGSRGTLEVGRVLVPREPDEIRTLSCVKVEP